MRTLLLAFFFALFPLAAAPGVAADQQPPAVAKAFLEAYNHPNSGAMDSWARQYLTPGALAHTSPAEFARTYARIYESSGALNCESFTSRSERELSLTVRSNEGKRGQLLILESAKSPGRIGGVYFFPLLDESRIPQLPQSAVYKDALPATIDEYVSALHAQEAFSGVVLVMRDRKLLFEGAYGLANRRRGIALTPDTQFATASLGKMFTAVAIAQLIERGKLRLDESLAEALPSYPNPEAARQITIGTLLEHSSGIPDYFELTSKRKNVTYDRPADYFALFASEPLNFKPGSQFSYSNSGFVVLGAIIERLSGEDFFSYVKQHIFEPAGMTHTSRGDEAGSGVALNYAYAQDDPMGFRGLVLDNDFFSTMESKHGKMRPTSSGGFASTAMDIERFYTALQQGRLISPAMLATMTKPRFVVDSMRKYGYGFETDVFETGSGIGHSGGGSGSGIDVWSSMLSDGRTDLIVLANQDVPAGMRVYRALAGFLLRQKP